MSQAFSEPGFFNKAVNECGSVFVGFRIGEGVHDFFMVDKFFRF